MAASWARYCRGKFRVAEPFIDVPLGNARAHRIEVEELGDATIRLTGIVQRRVDGDVPIRAWLRNRALSLVGFRVDGKGRLIGESLVPTEGLSASEFVTYVSALAAECDRFEALLTGRDDE